jgi:plasmid stabilization system protein ParE
MIVRLHPAAEQDISEAATFYGNAGSAKLAARFVAEFKRLAGILLKHPHIGVPRANGKRGLTMRRFPYTVSIVSRVNASQFCSSSMTANIQAMAANVPEARCLCHA